MDMILKKCKYCDKKVAHKIATLCERCWELKRRVDDDPKLVKKIFYEQFPEELDKQATHNIRLYKFDYNQDDWMELCRIMGVPYESEDVSVPFAKKLVKEIDLDEE